MSVCHSCKNKCIEGAKFCHHCGAKLTHATNLETSSHKRLRKNLDLDSGNINTSLERLMPKAFRYKRFYSLGRES